MLLCKPWNFHFSVQTEGVGCSVMDRCWNQPLRCTSTQAIAFAFEWNHHRTHPHHVTRQSSCILRIYPLCKIGIDQCSSHLPVRRHSRRKIASSIHLRKFFNPTDPTFGCFRSISKPCTRSLARQLLPGSLKQLQRRSKFGLLTTVFTYQLAVFHAL